MERPEMYVGFGKKIKKKETNMKMDNIKNDLGDLRWFEMTGLIWLRMGTTGGFL
jgi:hypothetical protein